MITKLHPSIVSDLFKPKRKPAGEKALERRAENDDRLDDEEAESGEKIVRRAAEQNDRSDR